MRRPLVIGNWKANGSEDQNAALLSALLDKSRLEEVTQQVDVAVCAPHVYLHQVYSYLRDTAIGLGAQDVSFRGNGAYTGDISAEMLADLHCRYVIVGHSERRSYHQESSQDVVAKAVAAIDQRLNAVVCIGETLAERESGQTLSVINAQLAPLIDVLTPSRLGQITIAYEPVWAIGSGLSATPQQAQEVHHFIREQLGEAGAQIRLLYGGSVKPDNASELFSQPDIDGGLIGGASLSAETFTGICQLAIK